MKRIFFFFLFLTYNFSLTANTNVDKLNDKAFSLVDNESEKALNFALSSYKISDSLNYNLGKINSLTVQGILYKNKGYYEVAIEKYLKALKYCEIQNDTNRMSVIYNNVGVIYLNQLNFDKAIKNFENALDIENKFKNNDEQKSIRLYNLGDAYLQLDSFELSKTYFYNSLLLDQKNRNNEGVIYAKIGIANCLFLQNKVEECNVFLNEIKNDSSLNELQKIKIKILLGDLNLLKDQFLISINNYEEALNISNTINNKPEELKILEKLYLAYKKEKKYSIALNYLELFNDLENELNGIKKSSLIEEMHYLYDFEKKDSEIKLLKKEKEFERISLSHEKSVKNYLFVTIILIALFFINNITKLVRNNNEK